MLTMKSLLPLMLVLAICWASDPIFDDVFPQSMDQVADNYRLSKDVIPTKYDIELEPIFEDSKKSFTFKGKSTITLNIEKDISNITFHSKELTYERGSLKYIGEDRKAKEETISAESIKSDLKKDFKILEFKEIIKKQKDAKLTLTYTGKINDNFRGFYKDSYQDNEGKKKWLAVTHFEPTSARQVFPCWDEPNFKAVFVISIKVPKINGYHALSNTRIETDKDKKVDGITLFEPTPNMSPYLVAFAVSDFKALNNSEAFGVWANPTVENTAKQFAHDYGVKTLEALKEFTTIDYYSQMSKMDQIAIPNFNAAMENWGLVTYRESGLLESTKTTAEKRQAIATVVAHELSHQWFGNLVTCEWWDYIWLNEGFATFFQYYISDKVIPKVFDKENWRFMEQFVVKNVQGSSFVVDASSKTRPLNPKHSVQKPAQIQSLFDDIAYKKGASILHMMYGFLNETIFQKGIVKYLNDNKNKAVNPNVFFKSVEDFDTSVKDYLPKDVNLQTVMKNWIEESGYPVVNATWKEKKTQEEKGPNDEIELKQERFFLLKPANKDKTQWYIPINYVTEDENKDKKEKMYWMIPEKEASIDKLNRKKWILLNHGQTGYYRVNYDISNWKLLATYLKTSKYININVVNRAQLIDDALNLARAGYLAYTSALPITQYLNKEDDYIPWYAAVRAFNYLDSVLLGGKNHTAYQMYVASKIKTFATKSNAFKDPKTSTHVEKLSQVLALNTACKYGLKECQDYVNKKFTEWLNDEKNEKDLNPDLRSGILCGALRKVDSEKWNKTLTKYKNTKDKDEKADILAGLGCASKEIAEIFLQLTLEKDPDIDIFSAMNSINAGNAESFDVLINFTNENIEAIRKADKDNTLLIAFLNKLSNNVVTTDQYAQLSLLVYEQLQEVEKKKFDGLSVLYKLAWIRSYRDEVEKWIAENCEVCQNEPGSASSIVVTSFVLITSLLLTRLY